MYTKNGVLSFSLIIVKVLCVSKSQICSYSTPISKAEHRTTITFH